MIPFNKPTLVGTEEKYVLEAIRSKKLSSDGYFTQNCHRWFEDKLACKKALLTTSCTHALEIAAMLINIQVGDEVIMPSYTFVSTANAFVLRGAKIVFVDIRPDTMNIDETLIEQAITEKTTAIVPVHYAGVSCEMETIMDIAERYNLFVIEDAAQGMMAKYKDRYLGTIGHLGTFSFHETKNYTSGGEGGLLLINDKNLIDRAEIIREKGTNRSLFFRGMVDKYSWVDIGSSYLPNELSAAYLWGQLQEVDAIQKDRFKSWHIYYKGLRRLANEGFIDLPILPKDSISNAHIFYLKVKDMTQRTELLAYLKNYHIGATFHYVPLHSSVAGKKYGVMQNDFFTTKESNRLIRLPLYYGIQESEIEYVVKIIYNFFKET